MRLHERLRRMIDGVPTGASVTLPVEVVEEWLEDGAIDVEPDLTVQEVAALFGRKPQTVRTWIREGRLEAYMFSGREYRITRRALQEFQLKQRRHRHPGGGAPEFTDQPTESATGIWTKESTANKYASSSGNPNL